MQIEICVDSLESAIAAERGGATRVELCRSMAEGGLTPGMELVRTVRAAVGIELFAMVRPRGGNYVYSETEYHIMQRDVATARTLGCDGVVLGLLTSGGEIDIPRTRGLVELARPARVTFHRAFDDARDLEAALEDVIAAGAHRILTSGGAPDARSGTQAVARLHAQAHHRIQIMIAGGVRPNNVAGLLRLTGVQAVHSSMLEAAASADDPQAVRGVSPGEIAELCRVARAAQFQSGPVESAPVPSAGLL